MSKHAKTPDATTALMEWVGHPDDPDLEVATKEIIDSHFGDPANTFKIAALAMARQELTAYPAVVQLENDLYSELFSERRRVTASTTELTQMATVLHRRKMSLIELANGDGLEKPRIEPRKVNAEDGESADASRFSPKQRERMRRALIALSQPKK